MNEQTDTILETALTTVPLAPLPAGFMARTLRQLPPRAVPVIRFRLEFLDMALPLAIGVFAAAILLVMGWYTGILSLDWFPTPANPLTLPSLTTLPLTTWAGIAVLVLAIEAMLTVVGVLAYSLWGDAAAGFSAPV